MAFWWSFHGLLWITVLIPLAGAVVMAAAIAWRSAWGRSSGGIRYLARRCGLSRDISVHDAAEPSPAALLRSAGVFLLLWSCWQRERGHCWISQPPNLPPASRSLTRGAGWAVAYSRRCRWYAWRRKPSLRNSSRYTWVECRHATGANISIRTPMAASLDSISGDKITLLTHVPSLCDDFGTQDLAPKLAAYQPGWCASSERPRSGTLEDLHTLYSLEQVASVPAFDDPDRNLLVLFKLHPLPNGKVRDPSDQNLKIVLPDDKIDSRSNNGTESPGANCAISCHDLPLHSLLSISVLVPCYPVPLFSARCSSCDSSHSTAVYPDDSLPVAIPRDVREVDSGAVIPAASKH